jgi:hypothetical protein
MLVDTAKEMKSASRIMKFLDEIDGTFVWQQF